MLVSRLIPEEVPVINTVVVDSEIRQGIPGHEEPGSIVLDQQAIVVESLTGEIIGRQLISLPVNDLTFRQWMVHVDALRKQARHFVSYRILEDVLKFLLSIDLSAITHGGFC